MYGMRKQCILFLPVRNSVLARENHKISGVPVHVNRCEFKWEVPEQKTQMQLCSLGWPQQNGDSLAHVAAAHFVFFTP